MDSIGCFEGPRGISHNFCDKKFSPSTRQPMISTLCGWETMLLTGFCVSNESGVGKKVLIGRVEIKKYARISINEEVVLVENYMPEEIDGDD